MAIGIFGLSKSQANNAYAQVLVYDGSAYPARDNNPGQHVYIGPASVPPTGMQTGDLWFRQDGI